MNRSLSTSVERWLRAESAAGAATTPEVDDSLAALFRALPAPLEASADFVDQVLMQVGLRVPRDLGSVARVFTAAALVLVSVAAFWLLPAAWGIAAEVELAALLAAAADTVTISVRLFGELLVWGERLVNLVRVLWLLAASPPAAALWLGSAAMIYVMWKWLSGLLATERSALHVS